LVQPVVLRCELCHLESSIRDEKKESGVDKAKLYRTAMTLPYGNAFNRGS
jgi:hypothetical protein